MVYIFFDKKNSGGAIKSVANQRVTDELPKPIIKIFKDNIWGSD